MDEMNCVLEQTTIQITESVRGAHGRRSGRLIRETDVAGDELQVNVWMPWAVDPSVFPHHVLCPDELLWSAHRRRDALLPLGREWVKAGLVHRCRATFGGVPCSMGALDQSSGTKNTHVASRDTIKPQPPQDALQEQRGHG